MHVLQPPGAPRRRSKGLPPTPPQTLQTKLEPRCFARAIVRKWPALRRHLRVRALLLPLLTAQACRMVQEQRDHGLLGGRRRAGARPCGELQGRPDGAHAHRDVPGGQVSAASIEPSARAGVQ